MNYKNQKNTEQDNDWAKNLEENYIHISQAQSGAQGYYCLGCDKAMLAAKGLIKKHYFRHVVKDADNSKKECVNSSREYREKLAYFYFMRVKKITVPAVYKYPPKGVDGFPNLIEEKQTIYAQRVDKEVTFFEDENGVIHSGKNTKVDERYLCIRPDAVFYDVNDKPILFIEFIVTHKPDTDKLNKLRRLGINTVQIIVPKKTEEELEKEISKASKVKWTYNEIESNTEYIPVSNGNSEGVPPLMRTKESFLKNLLPAEERKLRISYGQLQDVWNRNNSEEQQTSLDKKYQELRTLQKESEQDWKIYKQKLKEKSIQNLELVEQDLKKEIENFKLKTQIWKKDILEREVKLTEKSFRLTEISTSEKVLEELRMELEEILKEKKASLMKRKEEFEVLSNQIKVLRENLKMKREQLNENLKNYKTNLLKELDQEILKEIMNYPEESKKILKSWDISEILRKRNGYMNDIRIIKKSLELELGKSGKDLNWFESTLNDRDKQLKIDL